MKITKLQFKQLNNLLNTTDEHTINTWVTRTLIQLQTIPSNDFIMHAQIALNLTQKQAYEALDILDEIRSDWDREQQIKFAIN